MREKVVLVEVHHLLEYLPLILVVVVMLVGGLLLMSLLTLVQLRLLLC
jgi:uncharacterized integral membrane protein